MGDVCLVNVSGTICCCSAVVSIALSICFPRLVLCSRDVTILFGRPLSCEERLAILSVGQRRSTGPLLSRCALRVTAGSVTMANDLKYCVHGMSHCFLSRSTLGGSTQRTWSQAHQPLPGLSGQSWHLTFGGGLSTCQHTKDGFQYSLFGPDEVILLFCLFVRVLQPAADGGIAFAVGTVDTGYDKNLVVPVDAHVPR